MAESTSEQASFLNRLTASCLGTFDMATMYLGLQLGLYRSLADRGAATSTELASRTGTVERYVREWLEQQTVTGILLVDDAVAEAAARRYSIPAAHAEVLLDADSLNFMGAYPQQIISVLVPLPSLMKAFRQGGGVPYEAYGPDCREGSPQAIASPSSTCSVASGFPRSRSSMPGCAPTHQHASPTWDADSDGRLSASRTLTPAYVSMGLTSMSRQ